MSIDIMQKIAGAKPQESLRVNIFVTKAELDT
jgi:hypothetical protein